MRGVFLSKGDESQNYGEDERVFEELVYDVFERKQFVEGTIRATGIEFFAVCSAQLIFPRGFTFLHISSIAHRPLYSVIVKQGEAHYNQLLHLQMQLSEQNVRTKPGR